MIDFRQIPSDSGTGRPRFDDSVARLIRSAERFIAQQKYDLARDQLRVARTLEPRNSYLNAILERIDMLEAHGASPIAHRDDRYLRVSVGPQYADGVRAADPEISPAEAQSRIRQLTTAAEKFLDQGSVENAFDTLMKAFLLDPVSPYVLSCERRVIPAWETTHRPSSLQGETVHTVHDTPPAQAEQEKRLEALKLQKEAERSEYERALWREASRPPTVFGIAKAAKKTPPEDQRDLFTRLKEGKFLDR